MISALWQRNTIEDDVRVDTAKILLLREFISCPINGSSLETCGLFSVKYDALDKIVSPSEWKDVFNRSDEEWQAFLKILLDFTVRGNQCVKLPTRWKRIGGNRRIFGKSLAAPNAELKKASHKQMVWPQCRDGRQNKIVLFLGALKGWEMQSKAKNSFEARTIDTLLNRAFEQLRAKSILITTDSLTEGPGYVIDFDNKVSIVKNKDAWYFEGVNKLFDTIVGQPEEALCPTDITIQGARKVVVPSVVFKHDEWNEKIEIAWNDHAREARKETRQYMANQEDFQFLIEQGIWNRFGTYALEQTGYFAAGEHSAQVDVQRKDSLVENFRQGLLNVLSCFTTMEMGVDLDSINTVIMTDVPPHPANYMQRVGRAGRRKETRANAITLCNRIAREREVFRNPDWALTSKQPVLYVSMESEKIVYQHLHAQMLSAFFDPLPAGANKDRLSVVE